MEFTGERLVPGAPGTESLFQEHITRYMFASFFVEGRTVLDAGCGCGYGSHHLAQGGARRVLGLDCSEEAVTYGRNHFGHERLEFRTGDVLDTGLDTASFDTIVAFEVFEHLPEPDRFLEEMRRLLKPGGVLVLSTPNAKTYVAGGKDGDNPYHVREYTPDEFQEFLGECFPCVRTYAQSPWDGLGIFPAGRERTETSLGAAVRLVLPPGESAWGEPVPAAADPDLCAYLIAVCSSESVASEALPPAGLYAMGRELCGLSERQSVLQGQIRHLQSELEGRTPWIDDLKRDLEARDETIRKLQQEFEERSQWAVELDRTVRAQAGLIAALQRQRAIKS